MWLMSTPAQAPRTTLSVHTAGDLSYSGGGKKVPSLSEDLQQAHCEVNQTTRTAPTVRWLLHAGIS